MKSFGSPIGSALARTVVVAMLALLVGCASVLPKPEHPTTHAIAASSADPLAQAASRMADSRTLSSVKPLVQASFALDARLTLIRRAQSSIDLQTYQLAADKTGLLILRELRDAARRGVRVRMLLDDFYTTGLDPLLLGLASEPGVEIRLFNPFFTGRDHKSTRWLAFFSDFRRLNHRMHNKLFVADGAFAIAGGRNLADEYFLRSSLANFIDFELLMAGPVVAESSAVFDSYWNSDVVYSLKQVADWKPGDALQMKAELERRSSPEHAPLPDAPPTSDYFGDPALGEQLDRGSASWIRAEAIALADSPNKAIGSRLSTTETLAQHAYATMGQARSNVLVVSPYFIPGEAGLERIRVARERGIRITVVTNSLADSDEPLVNINYNRYRVEMLKLGVELREVSTVQLKRNRQLKRLLMQARGRLHAKLALIDREYVLLGSMNLDPRSERLNTEFGVKVRSFELTQQLLSAYLLDDLEGVYRVELAADGESVRWVGTGDEKNEVLDDEPDSSMLTRLQLLLFSWFVPTDQL
ncbi:Phosphatidylserine/phosphatidylglycerophosphate /cardiolipin synthase [Burkholderiales bacterium 8X]|nr:Phosphatidylserine/phosphatidylglycerophosphate /cardiolipin synthase [Burkholderiales bacterium 8X]